MRYIIGPENPEIIYISGGHFVSNGAWTHPRMILTDYELIVVLRGSFQLAVSGVRGELKEGDCMVLFPGEEHYGMDEVWNVSFYWLHFQFRGTEKVVEGERGLRDFAQRTGWKKGSRVILSEFCDRGENVRIIVMINYLLHYQSALKETGEAVRPCNLMMEMVLYEQMLAARIEEQLIVSGSGTEAGANIDRIYEYIRGTCYKNPQVFDIARHFGYNPQYFSRMFRKASGMTPKQYIISMQIEKAKYLLTTTNLRVKEISGQIGMNDVKTFFKHFKRSEGISPSAYRRAFRKTHYNSH